jgi:putative hydrolase of the HAD superfamily
MIKAVIFDNDGVLSKWGIPRPAVRQLALDLKNHGLKIAILSNINRLGAGYYRLIKIYDGFDKVFLSCQVKMKKPQAEYYMLAAESLGLKPEDILFIDNRKRLVEAAAELGFKIIQAKGSKQIVSEVKQVIQNENKLKL